MYVPGVTRRLYPRIGQGSGGPGDASAGGGGTIGGGEPGGNSSGSTGRQSNQLAGGVPMPIRTVSTYSQGGGPIVIIPGDEPFAGRSAGGGTRDQVYGSRTYGSGYPPSYPTPGRGVSDLGLPFYFWPLAWGDGLGYGPEYLHSHEYGEPNNSSRPGGPMVTSSIVSSSSNNTFHIVADETTVTLLMPVIKFNCTNFNINETASPSTPSPYNSSGPLQPRPEQVVQYYRASSVALTLDGYNDTTALQDEPTGPDVPIPSWVDGNLLNCINKTIGAAVPLVDAQGSDPGKAHTGGSGGNNPGVTPSAASIVTVPFSALWLVCLLVGVLL